MARILIGWELGAYSGHVRRMLEYAEAFHAAGHEVALALQRLDALAPEPRKRFALWQAPVWRRLLVSEAKAALGPVVSHADILGRLGLNAPGMLSALIAAWDHLIAAVRPDLVIAEYAPALLRAASSRVPTIAAGTGFDLPPAAMARFPGLADGDVSGDEDRLLELTNAELAAAGRERLSSLPGLFGADVAVPSAFAELDPYAQWRTAMLSPPLVALPIPLAEAERGKEVFVYWPEGYASGCALWDGLAKSGLAIRIHAPSLGTGETARLAGAGFILEPNPVPFALIAERSAIIVSHGGAGITSSAFVAGVPMVVVPVDLEKMVQARGVTRLGLGGWAAPRTIVADKFAADLGRLARDAELAARSRAAAPGFRERLTPDATTRVLRETERLLGS